MSLVMIVSIENLWIDGPYGRIPVRVYTPADESRAGLVWAHGGAFFGGDLDMPESDWVARQLADRGITVVAVDYRLAPTLDWATGATGDQAGRFHYPVASEEVTTAFTWAVSVHPAQRWAIGGASAGGTLTAGAALRLRDNDRPPPAAVLLAYPLLHAALPELPAELAAKVATLPNPELIGAEAVSRMNLNYVRSPETLTASYAFPGGHDLTGLPPTFILNADIDPLRASGQQYGAELAAAGVDLAMIRETGTSHGHLNEPDNPAATRSVSRMARWLLSLSDATDTDGG
ncbi:alpha/beta hydrolase [Actinoplanes subglobosus]|uniref:Alpha/beta hydrolase n=2 Tax=Actinoplanes subglobosus TaxID=1547892 RepID=A0ABV8IP19_9ACTN